MANLLLIFEKCNFDSVLVRALLFSFPFLLNCQLIDNSINGEAADPSGVLSGFALDVSLATGSDISPSNLSTITWLGSTTPEVTNLTFFSDPLCLNKIGNGIYKDFNSLGISLTPNQNSVSSIYALGEVAGGVISACEFILNHIHDDQPPASASDLDDWIVSASQSISSKLTWKSGLPDSLSGFSHFEYAIGNSPGLTDVVSWTETSAENIISHSGLSLVINNTYYYSLRVKDKAGNYSSVVSSDGWKVVPQSLSVGSVGTTALNWNDYYKIGDPLTDCTGLEGSATDCVHGGERKLVDIPSESSCSDLTFQDRLGAFDWRCDTGVGHVQFFTRNLKRSRSLVDLVDANSWKYNELVLIKNGVPISGSARSKWWTNPVLKLPENLGNSRVDLSTDSAIYTFDSSQFSAGYNIMADKVALVGLNGARITKNDSSTGLCSFGIGSMESLICSEGNNFLWIEGEYSGRSRDQELSLILLSYTRFSQLRFLKLQSAKRAITLFTLSDANFVHQVSIANIGEVAIKIGPGAYNLFHEVFLSNVKHGILNPNPYFRGHLTLVLYVNSGSLTNNIGSSNIFYNGITLAHINNSNGSIGSYGEEISYNQMLVYNTTVGMGFFQGFGTPNSTLSQSGFYHNDIGVQITAASNLQNKATGTLRFLSSIATHCDLVSTGPFMFSDSFCTASGLSDNNLAISTQMLYQFDGFRGSITSDDIINTTDNNGVADESSIVDWVGFESPFKTWIIPPPFFNIRNAGQRGECIGTTCQIWDWRTKVFSEVHNRSELTGSVNESFVVNGACPSAVNDVITNRQGINYLANAFEIYKDDIGNDNGVCESSEACVYMPNLGAYQGEGNYFDAGTCTYVDTAVTGVTMYAFPNN